MGQTKSITLCRLQRETLVVTRIKLLHFNWDLPSSIIYSALISLTSQASTRDLSNSCKSKRRSCSRRGTMELSSTIHSFRPRHEYNHKSLKLENLSLICLPILTHHSTQTHSWMSFETLNTYSQCANLEVLHLVKTPECTNMGIIEVAEKCRLLRKLHIDGWKTNRISDDGLIAVATYCPNLQELVLIGVNPTILSLEKLATNCQNLERLALCGSETIGDTEISCIAAKMLRPEEAMHQELSSFGSRDGNISWWLS